MSKIYDALHYLEAQRQAMKSGETPAASITPLDLQGSPTPAAHPEAPPLLAQVTAVARYGDELQRRMGEAGLDGVRGLFALADQLQRALATVSQRALDTAEADLERVANRVRTMQGELRRLKAVKADLERTAGLPQR